MTSRSSKTASVGWLWLSLAACGSGDGELAAVATGAGGAGTVTNNPIQPSGMAGNMAAMGSGGAPIDLENRPTPMLTPAAGGTGSTPNVTPPADPNRNCDVPPQPSELIGWASEGTGTTGGGDSEVVVVDNEDDFESAVEGDEPRVVHVRGSLEGVFGIGSNKTVIGLCDAQIRGHIGFSGASNSILRNIKVVGFNCSDSPNDCSGGDDAITIGDGSDHIWVDHLDVSDGSDGNLDITGGADFVTVSWTKFSYSTRRTDVLAGESGHRFSNLIGSSDTDARDPTHLNVTYHHIWWADNIDQRMPRTRRGQIHVFNNLYTAVDNLYCTDAGFEAQLLVQNNIYIGVNNPFSVRDGGDMRPEGNVFQNTTGTAEAGGDGFTPPYAFQLEATEGLEAAIRAGVGPK